jgi:ubiquinone/menaquinone biosynthesis C-methylase UbiE
MPKILPFQKYTARYEKWFEDNHWVYQAELKAVKCLLPGGQYGVEIGIGTGRFAEPLGVNIGVEPSSHMREVAQKRGIKVLDGVAEKLPLKDSIFSFVLMVTTICFVDDIDKSFEEAFRVLAKGGYLIIGLVDRNSPIGQIYFRHQNNNVFYKEATFYSVEEVLEIMKKTGFDDFSFRQTIFRDLTEINERETIKSGYGEGSFVVIRGKKK